MKINLEVDNVTISIAIAPDDDKLGKAASEVVDLLIEPALLALGYHPDSIRRVFASYESANDEEEKDETWEAGFSQGYADGIAVLKKGK